MIVKEEVTRLRILLWLGLHKVCIGQVDINVYADLMKWVSRRNFVFFGIYLDSHVINIEP